MSAPPELVQVIIQGLFLVRVGRYAIVSVFCLHLYEWLWLLEDEYNLIHRARWTSVKVAYLLCRYYPLSVWPVMIYAWVLDHDLALCTRLVKPTYSLLMPFQLYPQGVMLLRAYAFAGRKPRILLLLCTCYVVFVGVTVWGFCTNIGVPLEYFAAVGKLGCFPDNGAGHMATHVGIVMATGLVMDLVSLCIVLLHCRRVESSRGSLGRTFVKQGLGVFAVLFAVNLSAALVYFHSSPRYNGLGMPFMFVLPNILACRVILQLRRRASPTETEICRQHSELVRGALTQNSDLWIMDDGNGHYE